MDSNSSSNKLHSCAIRTSFYKTVIHVLQVSVTLKILSVGITSFSKERFLLLDRMEK